MSTTNPFEGNAGGSASPAATPLAPAASTISTNPFDIPLQLPTPPRPPHSTGKPIPPPPLPSSTQAVVEFTPTAATFNLNLDATAKSHLIEEVLALQRTLRAHIHRLQEVGAEHGVLVAENEVLLTYINNLMGTTMGVREVVQTGIVTRSD